MHRFGNKKILWLCGKINRGDYKDPAQVIFQFVREDRIDSNQFKMLVYSINHPIDIYMKEAA